MPLRLVPRLTVLGVVAIVSVGGCSSGGTPQAQPTSAPATRTADPNVIDFVGVRDVRIGASMQQMTEVGLVATASPACGPSFPSMPFASPVFDGDQLVLIWANPPLRTPESVIVGTSIQDARRAYPAAIELTRPSGSTRYPGLLILGGGDRAYLLLHDADQIQKLVVGIERYVRLLFDTDFGSC